MKCIHTTITCPHCLNKTLERKEKKLPLFNFFRFELTTKCTKCKWTAVFGGFKPLEVKNA